MAQFLDVLTPVSLTIPTIKGGIVPSANIPTGTIFISGGSLCWTSGAQIIQITFNVSGISGASLT